MESFMVIEFVLRLEEAAGICLEGRGGGAQKLLDRQQCSNKGEQSTGYLGGRKQSGVAAASGCGEEFQV